MKLIVGLGNPGKQYENTRHNIGFKVIDQLCKHLDVSLNKEKFQGVYCLERFNGEKFILLKPLTYMNLSGQSVQAIMNYYNIDTNNLLVIYDDLDLPVGRIRLRQKGSAGGHNGMRSIISQIGTEQFNRIRIGIDRPQKSGMSISNYVLSNFTKEELVEIDDVIVRCADAVEQWFETPFVQIMNNFNN